MNVGLEYRMAIHQSLRRILYDITRKPAWTYIYTALAELGLRRLYDSHAGFALWLRDGSIDLGRSTASVGNETVAGVAFRLCQAAYYTGVERGVESDLAACSELFGDSYKHVDGFAKSHGWLVKWIRAGVLRACIGDIGVEQSHAELLLATPSAGVYRAQGGLVELSGFYVKAEVLLGGRWYEYYMSYPRVARYPCFELDASGIMPRRDGAMIEFPSQSEVMEFPKALGLIGALLRDASNGIADAKCVLRNRCADALSRAVDYGYMAIDELAYDSAMLVSRLAYRLFADGELS